MDEEAWWATVHGVTKSRTRLSDFTYLLTYLLTLVKFFLSSRLFLVTYIPGKHVKFMKSTSSKYVVCCFLEAETQIFKSLSEE